MQPSTKFFFKVKNAQFQLKHAQKDTLETNLV